MRRALRHRTLLGVAVPILAVLFMGGAAPAGAESAQPLYIVIFRDPSEAEELTLTYERRLGIKLDSVFSRTIGGFAARLTPSQLRTLRNEIDRESGVVTVARSGAAELTAYLALDPGVSPTSTVDRLELDLGIQATYRFSRTMSGFSTRLTAAKLARLSRRPEISRIVGHPYSFIVSVEPEIDGVEKARRVAADLQLTPHITFSDWFSVGNVMPWQLARLDADPEVSRVAFNGLAGWIDPWENPGSIVEMGRGFGTWRILMKYRAERRLVRTVTNPSPGGCFGTARTADWVDYYPGVRLSWQNGRLTNVATTRWFTQTSTGFRIGAATLAQVRARFPAARFFQQLPSHHPYWKSRYRLGRFLVEVTRNTGVEEWINMNYWFDRRGKLVALETFQAGC